MEDICKNRESLPTDRRRAVEDYYKSFARNGALLEPAQKEELNALNSELTGLYIKFTFILLNATILFEIVVDHDHQLVRLAHATYDQCDKNAWARNLDEGKWVFTLYCPNPMPLLTVANYLYLREKMSFGWPLLSSYGEHCCLPIIDDILFLAPITPNSSTCMITAHLEQLRNG